MVKTAQTYIYPKFWQATNLIVIYIFIQTLIDFPLALYDYHHDTNWLYEPWIKIPVFVGSTLFILFLGYYYSGLTVKEVFPLKRFRIGLVPALLAALIPLQFFLTEISIQFDKVLPPPRWFMELFARLFDSDFGVWSGVLRVVIIAPVVEELIFRGAIMSGFIRNYKPVYAIFFSALLFALFPLNPWQFPATFLLGLILGWVRIRTNSVLACIAGHAIHNGLVFLAVIYSAEFANLTFLQHGQSINYLINGVILSAGLFLIYFSTGFIKKQS